MTSRPTQRWSALLLPSLQAALALGAALLLVGGARPTARGPLVLDLALFVLSLAVAAVALRATRAHARLLAQNRRLSTEASTDSLTGLGNRRRFDDRLRALWSAAIGDGSPLSLMLIDVDYFKAFNDALGHLEGDRVLRMLGDTLRQAGQRSEDETFRFGGEEFAIILPQTGSVGASKVAAGIQRAIAELGIEHEASPTGCLTASIGVSQAFPARQSTDRDQLLAAADHALYEAKRAGRNRIKVGLAPPPRGAGAEGSKDVHVDGCDIILANGRTVRISTTLDTATLSSILQVVGAQG